MNKRVPLFLVLFVGLNFFLHLESESNEFCSVLNENAEVPAQQYSQVASRTFREWRDLLGADAESFLRKLKPGSRVFDAGGGFSIYGISQARLGLEVITSNAQDFYGELLRPLTEVEQLRRFVVPNRFGTTKKAFRFPQNTEVFEDLREALNLSYPAGVQLYKNGNFKFWEIKDSANEERVLRAVSGWLSNVLSNLEGSLTQGRFQRRVGMSQEILKSVPDESVLFYEDIVGSAFYSSDRLVQFESAYSKLSPGGRAYFYMENGMADSVSSGLGTPLRPLLSVLAQTFPNLIQTYSVYHLIGRRSIRGQVLMLEKPISGHPQTLSFPLRVQSVGKRDFGVGSVIPVVTYGRVPH